MFLTILISFLIEALGGDSRLMEEAWAKDLNAMHMTGLDWNGMEWVGRLWSWVHEARYGMVGR